MADSEYILMKLVAPIMGFILANVMFFSGVPGMLRCKRLGGLGDMNPLPFPVVLANCISWIIYSIFIEDYFLFFSNAPGAMVGMYFTLVAYGLSAYKSKMRDALEMWLMTLMFALLALTLYVGEGSEKGGVGGHLIKSLLRFDLKPQRTPPSPQPRILSFPLNAPCLTTRLPTSTKYHTF